MSRGSRRGAPRAPPRARPPMRRGLKLMGGIRQAASIGSAARAAPYEKGTETVFRQDGSLSSIQSRARGPL